VLTRLRSGRRHKPKEHEMTIKTLTPLFAVSVAIGSVSAFASSSVDALAPSAALACTDAYQCFSIDAPETDQTAAATTTTVTVRINKGGR
jgi:hypothetical protein